MTFLSFTICTLQQSYLLRQVRHAQQVADNRFPNKFTSFAKCRHEAEEREEEGKFLTLFYEAATSCSFHLHIDALSLSLTIYTNNKFSPEKKKEEEP